MIPREVNICGTTWKVEIDPKRSGGQFKGAEYLITVGSLYPKEVLHIFIHEVLEAILTERNYRFAMQRTPQENGDLRYFMNHEEFDTACRDLSVALGTLDLKTIGNQNGKRRKIRRGSSRPKKDSGAQRRAKKKVSDK